MKYLSILTFLLPFAVAGQTTTDYEHAMEKFQKFYNAGLGDSINAMFKHDQSETRPLWTNASNASRLQEIGTLKSFKFIGIDNLDPDKVYVFETYFSKAGTKTTSLTLNKDFSLGTFRFMTRSEGITALQKNYKRGR